MLAALATMPGVRPFTSEANMVLVRVQDAARTFAGLRERKVLIKNVSTMHPLLHNCLRLTVGNAQDNATISANAQAIFDWFDPITPQGWDLGGVTRQTLTFNVSGTQVLSPTTLGGVSYGLTYQTGTLEQTWNVVPQVCSDPTLCPPQAAELFPDSRLRHAVSAWLAQRIPATGTTLRAHYRYYRDDFGLDAHTGRLEVWQDAGEHLRLRAHYRLHSQSAVSFWTSAVAPSISNIAGRTFPTVSSNSENAMRVWFSGFGR